MANHDLEGMGGVGEGSISTEEFLAQQAWSSQT
eukprot:COSAG02_NODE_35054_length_474_cov_1.560000_1_plen_32_part_10